jgi:hypothetical protein
MNFLANKMALCAMARQAPSTKYSHLLKFPIAGLLDLG